MKKKYPRRLLVSSGTIALIVAIVVGIFICTEHQISIEQKEAQAKIQEKLPIVKEVTALKIPFTVTINEVNVNFEAANKLEVIAKGSFTTPKGSADIEIKTIGQPEYGVGSFYFKPSTFEFTKFELSLAAKDNTKKLAKLGRNLAKNLNEGLLKDTDIQINTEGLTKKIRDAAQIAVGKVITGYLNTRPIYKLKGTKGFFISLAITELKVENDVLLVSFSLLQLTLHLIFLLLLSIAMVGALLTAPWWAQGLFCAEILLGGFGS